MRRQAEPPLQPPPQLEPAERTALLHPSPLLACPTTAGLGAWAARQRHAWKVGRLPAARQQQLAALGLTADVFQDAWAARFRQLAAFHSEHGHCHVPLVTRPTAAGEQAEERGRYPGLHAWLAAQRQQWQQGTLPDERQRRLQGLGVQLGGLHEGSWEQHFAQLLAFREVGLTWH